MDPVMTEPVAGTTEIWRFINTTVVAHPMHVHLATMRVLDRQRSIWMRYMRRGQIVTSGRSRPPAPNELNAPKDTVRVDFGHDTRVLLTFDVPPGCAVMPRSEVRGMCIIATCWSTKTTT